MSPNPPEYIVVLWQSGMPPTRAFGPTADKAAAKAAGQNLAQSINAAESGFGLATNYTVLALEAMPV